MGNKQSVGDPDDESVSAADKAQVEAAAQRSPLGARLYKHTLDKAKPWVLVGPAEPDFANDADNEEDDAPDWYFNAGEVEVRVDDSNRFICDKPNRRASFWAGGGVYALKFNTSEGFDAFEGKLKVVQFENAYGLKRTEANLKKVAGEEAMDVDYVDEEPPAPPPPRTPGSPATAGKGLRFRESLATPARPGGAAEELQLGALERSYVLRADGVDVFKNTREGLVDAAQQIDIRALGVTPQKAIMANTERQFVFLTPQPENRQQVAQFDIETEKVIHAWKPAKDGVDQQLVDIVTRSKGAQLTDDKTFMSVSGMQLMYWDMRTAAGGQAASSSLASPTTYAGGTNNSTNFNFTCVATTGAGHVAVANNTGEVRCFTDKTLTRPKTNFPGLGSKITHLDVSYDGKWVLATTDHYVAVLCTWAKVENKVKTAFESQLASKLAAPRLLRLKPQDQQKVGTAPFRQAKFTWITEGGKQERRIVASIGNNSIVWDFAAFKRATAPGSGVREYLDYTLQTTMGQVVDSGFAHANWAGARSAQTLVQTVRTGAVHTLVDEDEED